MVEYFSKVTQSIELTVQSLYASKNELLPKCIKGALKPTENFQAMQFSAVSVFKTSEITFTVEFLSSADANGFPTEYML